MIQMKLRKLAADVVNIWISASMTGWLIWNAKQTSSSEVMNTVWRILRCCKNAEILVIFSQPATREIRWRARKAKEAPGWVHLHKSRLQKENVLIAVHGLFAASDEIFFAASDEIWPKKWVQQSPEQQLWPARQTQIKISMTFFSSPVQKECEMMSNFEAL
jgi:hypothetical protein